MTRTRWIDAAWCLLLFVLVFVAFQPALHGEFLQWDDDRNFLANSFYRGVDEEHLRWMFTTFHMGPYQPLSWLTLGVDHELWGMDPAGYHRTSIAIHGAAVAAFFLAARRLFDVSLTDLSVATRTLCAAFAAITFGLHPLRAESVAWITERRDVVSGLFFSLTLLAWILAVGGERRRAGWYAASLILFTFALLSKATVVGLPVVLFALDVWPFRRWSKDRRRVTLDLVPFVALSIVFAFVAVRGQASTGSSLRALADYGVMQRIAQTLYSCAFYPWKTLWPSDLSPIYDVPSPFDPFAARFVVAGVVVVVLSVLAWTLRKRAPVWTVAWIAFLALVAPVSGIVSIGPQLVADRYSYLACMPFAMAAAAALGIATERGRARTDGLVPLPLVVVLLGVGTPLVLATRAQAAHWRTTSTLWERAYAVDPDSAVACQQLGVVRTQESQDAHRSLAERAHKLEEALALYTHAYEIAPHPNHVFNIAGIAMQRAELDPASRAQHIQDAIETFQEGFRFARETTGVDPRWRVMYANALVEVGLRAEARSELEIALAADPTNVGALLWMSRVEREDGNTAAAIQRLETVTQLAPENATAWRALVALHDSLGHTAEAAAVRERARGVGVLIEAAVQR